MAVTNHGVITSCHYLLLVLCDFSHMMLDCCHSAASALQRSAVMAVCVLASIMFCWVSKMASKSSGTWGLSLSELEEDDEDIGA